MNPTRRRLFGAILGAPAVVLPASIKPAEAPPQDMLLQPYTSTAGFTQKWNELVRKVYGK